MLVLLERHRVRLRTAAEPQLRVECMWLGNFLDRLQSPIALDEGELLPRAIGPNRLHRYIARHGARCALEREAESRGNPFLEYLEQDNAIVGLDPARLVVGVI